MLLENRVAIITGGAKGMGKGMALKLADEGASIVVADISVNEANDTIAEVRKKGVQGLAVRCDVTDGEQVKDVVDQTIRQFGKIDILVNNAGGTNPLPPIEDMPEELWDKMINLNLKSHFLFCKYVVPHMKAKKYGKIIGISSIGAINPPHHAIAYNTAKAAVIGFTYDLAWALAPYNINVNAILPGPIATEFYDRARGKVMSAEEKQALFASLGKKVPMQKIGTPEDMGNAVLYFSSEMSSFVTGTTLLVAGGLPLLPQNIQFA